MEQGLESDKIVGPSNDLDPRDHNFQMNTIGAARSRDLWHAPIIMLGRDADHYPL